MAGKHPDGTWKSTRSWPSRPVATDRHAPAAISPRPPSDYYSEPDEIELDCCVAEYADGGWRHSRSCPFRRQAARTG